MTAVLFATGLGLTGDATVSPTAGLVNARFALARVATLIGFLFLCYQIGAFASAWLGGLCVTLTGGYTYSPAPDDFFQNIALSNSKGQNDCICTL